jgi:hypothetical protein
VNPVKEADPAAKSLDAAFAAAMGAPPKPKEPAAPKDIDPLAPHGRDPDGSALAPFGLTKDGIPRKTAAGRPANVDQPRTGKPEAPRDDKAAVSLAQPGQHAKELAGTADGIWFMLSAIGKAAPGIPLIGHRLPAVKIQAQAAVWFATKDRAVAAVSLAAEHNASAARFARKLQADDITWMITCVSLIVPILSLSSMVWAKDADAQLKAAEQPSLAELKKKNEAAMDDAIAQITAQVEAAAKAQMNGEAAA